MDFLWTPWRYSYVTASGDPGACVFCTAGKSTDDRQTGVVFRAQHNFVILNRYPYTSGHVMVVPFQHIATLAELPDEAQLELIRLASRCERILRSVYKPDGLNLGMNMGKSAGAGIAGHVHLHILPRWTGDTNFMTVVGETRVVPESLENTYDKLSAAFQDQSKS